MFKTWIVRLRRWWRIVDDDDNWLKKRREIDARNEALLKAFEIWLSGQKKLSKTRQQRYLGKIHAFCDFITEEMELPHLARARADDVDEYWDSDWEPFDGEDDLDHLLGALDYFFRFLSEAGHTSMSVYKQLERIIEENESRLYHRAARQDR